jgi:diguanylate cyclase (GGDEF)-like protein/PAS domain S-box-containing protein
LKESEARFRAVAETAQDAIILIDAGGGVRFWNRSAERILGYSAAEAQEMKVHDIIVPQRFRAEANAALVGFAATGTGAVLGKTVELAAIRKDGREIPIELSVAGVEIGSERDAVAVIRDITERKRNEERILQLARFDALTGLANRTVFAEGVQLAIARAQRGGKGFAVLYLDLDHFKDVNDTLGHPIGDRLLKSVAERLKAAIRETDTVARFGGDEFAVLAADIEEPADAGNLGAKLLKAIGEPVVIDGNEIRSGTSVGISVYGPDSPDPEILLSHADVALYRAKSEGRGTFRFFTDAMDDEVRSRVALDGELRVALAERQFYLVYQPQVDLRTGRIVGVEALVVAGLKYRRQGLPVLGLAPLSLRESCRGVRRIVVGASP